MDLKKEKNLGHQKGKEEGIKENQIQVVKAMIKKNIDIDTISEITGLTKEEIENIVKN